MGNTQKDQCPNCSGLKDSRAMRCKSCAGKQRGKTGEATKNGKQGAAVRWGSGQDFKKCTYRYVNNHGYIQVKTPTWSTAKRGWMAEHRYVMERFLNRPLLSDESVHHKNGIKTDNRIDNLELWTTNQPIGQRVEDLLFWAHQIIDKYNSMSAI